MLLLDLGQPAGLKGGVGGLVPTLRVAVDLDGVGAGGEGEGVEGVLDTGGVEGRGLAAVRGGVELGEVQRAAGLLLGGLVVLGARGEGGFLGGELGVALSLLARGFGLFGGFLLSVGG